ncbi:MAG: DNA primase [Alloprevotella sp.]|nr:DNA primase [Alloprevotella sp.]
MIDRNTIERIISAANIVDVVGEYVTLRKAGANYKGLCPFHNEKTPSFVVFPSSQRCKCFGCGKGGNAIHFLMEMDQLTYPEAIKRLGKRYGIEVRERELSDEERALQSERESMFIVNEWAMKWFETNMQSTDEGKTVGLSYFRSRGLRDDIIEKFHLGYSPERIDALSKAAVEAGYKSVYLQKTGLSLESSSHRLIDRYHGRVIYPVRNISGKVVAFGGRILSQRKDVGKYVNSPQSEIYDKSRELYGLFEAKKAIVKQDCCFLVEGYMDVISMHQSGIENVVASSGTSLTHPQIHLLHRFTRNITVLYDGDAAGIHASLRGIDMLLEEGMNIRVLLLPDGDDPDSFARKHSAEEFRNYIEAHQTDFIDFKSRLLLADVGNDPIKRASVITDIVHSISVVPDGIVRQTYAHQCARLFGLREEAILAEITKQRDQAARSRNNAANAEAESAESVPVVPQGETATMRPETNKIELAEHLLITDVIRHGAETLASDGENGAELKVVDYVQQELGVDDLVLQTPLYRLVLQEAASAVAQGKNNLLSYFAAHPDPEFSKLALELGDEDEMVKANRIMRYDNEKAFLADRMVQLINDYKFVLVETKLSKLRKELAQIPPSETARMMEVLTEINSLMPVQQALAKVCTRTIAR